MLAIYFGTPGLVPRLGQLFYSSGASVSQIMSAGRDFHGLLELGTWLQVTGALLAVVFLVGLGRAVPSQSMVASILLVGCCTLLAVVLAEAVFSVTWLQAAQVNDATSGRVSFALMSSFIRIFPIVPAPAVYVPLGIILRRSRRLPPGFAWTALVIGVGFLAVGIAGIVVPGATIGAAVLSSLQDLWILAAGIGLLVGHDSEQIEDRVSEVTPGL